MESRFGRAVLDILQQEQRLMEEQLLRLLLSDIVFLSLAGVAAVPFESFDGGKIDHYLYITTIYKWRVSPPIRIGVDSRRRRTFFCFPL
jgi:hypothetical protein